MQHCAVKTLRNHRARPAPKPPQIRQAVVPLRPLRKAGCSCGGGCPTCKSLSVAPAHGPAEREADRVADQVMRMPEPVVGPGLTAISAHSGAAPVQRVCADCEAELNRKPAHETIQRQEDEEEELQLKRSDGAVQRQEEDEEEDLIQTKEAPGAGPALTAASAAAIQSLHGGGVPLPAAERAFFEPRFGHDFSNVRIHDGPKADAAAKSINARAFTVGNDIAFATGEHRPGSSDSRRLMAHELTHTVQQHNGMVPASGENAVSSAPDGRAKRAADAIAAPVATREPVRVRERASGLVINRQAPAPVRPHRFTAEGVRVVVRRSCAPDVFGFAFVEFTTAIALDQIFNSECIERSRRTRMRQNLTRHGLDIRCRRSANLRDNPGDCAESSPDANIMWLGSHSFVGHPESLAGCQPLASTILHEIVHFTRGVGSEGLPNSCEASCFPEVGGNPDLCHNIDVFGNRVGGGGGP